MCGFHLVVNDEDCGHNVTHGHSLTMSWTWDIHTLPVSQIHIWPADLSHWMKKTPVDELSLFSEFFFFSESKDFCVSWKNENLRMPDSAIFVVSDENEWPIIFAVFWVDRRSTPWLIQSLNQLTIPAEIRRFELNCLTIQRNAGIGWNWQRKGSRTCWLRRSRFGNCQPKNPS